MRFLCVRHYFQPKKKIRKIMSTIYCKCLLHSSVFFHKIVTFSFIVKVSPYLWRTCYKCLFQIFALQQQKGSTSHFSLFLKAKICKLSWSSATLLCALSHDDKESSLGNKGFAYIPHSITSTMKTHFYLKVS